MSKKHDPRKPRKKTSSSPEELGLNPSGTVGKIFSRFLEADFRVWVPMLPEGDMPIFPINPNCVLADSPIRECGTFFTRRERGEEFLSTCQPGEGQMKPFLLELNVMQLAGWILDYHEQGVEVIAIDQEYISFTRDWLPFCYKLFPAGE